MILYFYIREIIKIYHYADSVIDRSFFESKIIFPLINYLT